MKKTGVKKYLQTCFLLMLPPIFWNILFAAQLPHEFQPGVFWNEIPTFIVYGENISRVFLFGLTLIMPLKVESKIQEKGLLVYLCGLLFYFLSWLALIYLPESCWSSSEFGFMVPAFSPLFWLTPIAFIGNSFSFRLSYRRWYFVVVAIVFLLFHNLHAYIVLSRL